MCFAMFELFATVVAETQEVPDSLWWKLLKITVVCAVGIGVGIMVEKARRAFGAFANFATNRTGSRPLEKTPPHHDGEGIKVSVENMAEKLNQSEQKLESLRASIEKSTTEISRLTDDKQKLERQVADLKAKLGHAGHLEKVFPELIDWIQSVIGYAGNKCLFPEDADELAKFRTDAEMLPILLRSNGIQCNRVPPSKGLGFVHKRDARIAEGKEVVSAPMLLREGVIIAEGIVLVPDVDVVQDEGDSRESKDRTDSLDVTIGVENNPMKEESHLPLCGTPLADAGGVNSGEEPLSDNIGGSDDENLQTNEVSGSSPSWDFGL